MSQIKLIYELLSGLQQALLEMRLLLIKEREDIVNLNLRGLGERQTRIEKLFGRINGMNEQISTQIAALCDKNGVTGEKTLSALIAILPKTDREMFVRLQAGIHKISAEIGNALKVNQGILKDSLALTNQSMTLFTGMLKNSNTYGQAGRFVETVDRSRIINREI